MLITEKSMFRYDTVKLSVIAFTFHFVKHLKVTAVSETIQKAADRRSPNYIRKLFAKAHRWGLTKNLYDADEMFEARDRYSCSNLCVILLTAFIICCRLTRMCVIT